MTAGVPPGGGTDGLTHDAFVSYRRSDPDRAWVTQRLVPALRASGVRVLLDEDDFRLGEPLVLAMTRAVERSRYTVAVLTPAYLASSYTELESLMAEHLGLENAQSRLIGVMRETVAPRLSLRLHIWLDMTDDSGFDTAVARLAREVVLPWPETGAIP
ncbi:toll/interleukin-1 receptor domain-containing protein [Terrabacter sp. NPDC000476]|uniref:toll/interleukin-1 receptor domain-containing protein n=1 Tax=Terrabacter sp. NPDC000476 TaxID=3154258 RepID=UPI0033316E88